MTGTVLSTNEKACNSFGSCFQAKSSDSEISGLAQKDLLLPLAWTPAAYMRPFLCCNLISLTSGSLLLFLQLYEAV